MVGMRLMLLQQGRGHVSVVRTVREQLCLDTENSEDEEVWIC